MTEASSFEVRAAGGVVWRPGTDGPEVAVAHRPRYDDWSLPKGKLDAGESFEEAAVREVEEEIGVRCELGEELPFVAYRDNKGRSKIVRYWVMEAAADDERSGGEASGRDRSFEPNDEVDDLVWLAVDEAMDLLSYPRDRELLGYAKEMLG